MAIVLKMVKKLVGLPLTNRSRRLAKQFLALTSQPAETQRDLLLNQIARNTDSQFGRDHHFGEIRNHADYRKRVPIRDYGGHEPYLQQVREGNIQALFGPNTDILMFAKTSGTTATPKTIPITRQTLQNYRDGWTIWGIQAFDAHYEMIRMGMKPILQFASDWRESTTPAGIPCGAITGLTAHMQNRIVRVNYCMTPEASRIKDIDSKYYTAIRLSIHREIGTIIAANPSTILSMVRLCDREKESIIRDIADGSIDSKWSIPPEVRESLKRKLGKRRQKTAKRLEKIINQTGRLAPSDYWPSLDFLSNWTGGTMGVYLKDYPTWFGALPVRDVGLIASEGRMSIPIEDGTPGGVLDIRHQYFEFIPEEHIDRESPDTLLAHELEEGKNYFILLTNASGLYRYHISDLVKCVGFHQKTPLIAFLNKGSHYSSVAGEKLSESQVVSAIESVQKRTRIHWSSYLMLPVWGNPPHYSVLVEQPDLQGVDDLDHLANQIDHELQHWNEEYENRRETKRLGPLQVVSVAEGSWKDWQKRRLAKSGGSLEQYKKPCLLPDLETIQSFTLANPEAK